MSFLKKPFRKLKDIGNSNSAVDKSITEKSIPSKVEGINSSTGSGTDSPNGKPNGASTPVTNGTSTPKLNGDSKRQSREAILAERARKSMDRERAKVETKKRESMARIEDERFLQEGPPSLTKLYRPYSMNQSKRWTHEDRLLFKNLDWESACPFLTEWLILLIWMQNWTERSLLSELGYTPFAA
jgi:ergosteryl-3beta-O-L-aspartate synthase